MTKKKKKKKWVAKAERKERARASETVSQQMKVIDASRHRISRGNAHRNQIDYAVAKERLIRKCFQILQNLFNHTCMGLHKNPSTSYNALWHITTVLSSTPLEQTILPFQARSQLSELKARSLRGLYFFYPIKMNSLSFCSCSLWKIIKFKLNTARI